MSNPAGTVLPRQRAEITHVQEKSSWHLFLYVDFFEGGSHKRYDVLFNSDCNSKFFDTFFEAAKEADKVLKSHKQKHGY